MKTINQSNYTIYSVEKALNILFLFTKEKSLTATEIATKLDLSYSTTFRLITTLVTNNFLRKSDDTLRYSLGRSITVLNDHYIEPYTFKDAVIPYMQAVTDELGETTALFAIKNIQANERVCIARKESNHRLRSSVQVGEILPLTNGSSGRLLAAYLPEKDRKYLQSLSSEVDEELLKNIREQGYCSIANSRIDGTTGFFVPIFHPDGHVLGALGISGASFRFEEMDLKHCEEFLKNTSEKITADLRAKNYKA